MPVIGIPPEHYPRLLEKRKHASVVARNEQCKEDLGAETIADKCCFYMDMEKLQEKRWECLTNFSNEFVQKIYDKIFLEGKCCAKHIDGLVMTLLNPKVTEFNYLCLWEHEDHRGFEKFADLCLKCPNLEKLRTLKLSGYNRTVLPKFETILNDVIQLKNLKELALYVYNCALEDLWTIQKNLLKLEHLEVVLAKPQLEIAAPFAEMSNLKRLHLCQTESYQDRAKKIEYADILVECAGRIKGLNTLFFVCDEGKLFVENYAARFPDKQLHVDKMVFKGDGLSVPWPSFLTCNAIELKDITGNLVIENFASIKFPVKEFVFGQCVYTYLHPMIDIIGQNVESLRIMDPSPPPGSITSYIQDGELILDEVVLKCPNLQNLMVVDWDFSYSLEDWPMDERPAKQEIFAKIKKLTLAHYGQGVADDEKTIGFYKDMFLMTKNVDDLSIDLVGLSKAALQAMAADPLCFEKLEELSVSTSYEDNINDSRLVFKVARNMMYRSPRLKKIVVTAQTYSTIGRYRSHWQKIRSAVESLKSWAEELGIEVGYDENDCD